MAKTLRKETRKEKNPWFGWKNLKPSSKKEKTTMKRNCGKKCFLGSSVAGSQSSFPKALALLIKKGSGLRIFALVNLDLPKRKAIKNTIKVTIKRLPRNHKRC